MIISQLNVCKCKFWSLLKLLSLDCLNERDRFTFWRELSITKADRNDSLMICTLSLCLLLSTSIYHVLNTTLSSDYSIPECVSAVVSLLSFKCAARGSMGPGPVRDTVPSCCREQLRTGTSEPCTSRPLLQTALSGWWLGRLCPEGGSSGTSFAFTSTTISKQGDSVLAHTHTLSQADNLHWNQCVLSTSGQTFNPPSVSCWRQI